MKRLTSALLTLLAICGGTPAQAPTTPVFGHEVFITMDADTLSGWTCIWWNIRLQSPDGGIDVVDFEQFNTAGIAFTTFVSNGYGAWGPQFPDGDYVVEPFWLSSSVGNLGGVFHGILFPSTVYLGSMHRGENAQGIAPGHRQGLRVARADGQAFALSSFDYFSADTDFEIGTELEIYADFAGFQTLTPVLGASTWNTLTFPVLPPDNVPRIDFVPSSGTLNVNAAIGALGATTTIARVHLGNGTIHDTAALNPLVGGTLSLSGSFTGTDLVGLSDMAIPAGTVTITATDGAQLQFTAPFLAEPTHWRFVGVPETFPVELLPLTQTAMGPITVTGPANPQLDGLAARLTAERLTLHVHFSAGTPRLFLAEKEYFPGPQGPTHLVHAPGDGSFALSAYLLDPLSPYRHVFQPNPTGPLGSGPFFGIPFGPLQIQQLLLPQGFVPFHGQVSAAGTIAWSVPPGTLPMGLASDVLFLDVRSGALVSDLVRVVF